jgi:hypothetical protein
MVITGFLAHHLWLLSLTKTSKMNKLKIYLTILIALATFQTTSAQGTGTGDPVFVNPGGTNTLNITSYFIGSDPNHVITHIRITAFPTYTTSIKIGSVLYSSATFPAAGVTFPIGTTVLLDPVDGINSPAISYKVTDNAGFESLNTTHLIIMLTNNPDLMPTVDIDGLSFPVADVPRDFVVNIFEINDATAGNPIAVRIAKLPAFNITYPTVSSVSNVYGGIANENSNWDFTEDAGFITATAKPGVTIPASGSAKLGFTIARKPNIASGVIQTLGAIIVSPSGGEVNVNNNSVLVSVAAN